MRDHTRPAVGDAQSRSESGTCRMGKVFSLSRRASYHALLSILRKGLSVDAGPGLSYQLGSNYGPGDFFLSKGAHGKHVAGTTER
jgi:hypothetical protein